MHRLARIYNPATFNVWHPPIRGGDPTLTLDDKVREIGKTIESKRAAAKQAWARFEDARKKLADSDVDITDSDSEEFKAAHEIHATYGTLADELDALTQRQTELWAMTSERGKTDPSTPQREVRETLKQRVVESYGRRVVGSELYKTAAESGVFLRNSKSRIGEIQLGEMMDRDEFHAVITGADDTSGGAFVVPTRAGYVQRPDQPLLLTQLITVSQTGSDTVEYVRETGFTNAAAFVPEASTDDPIGSGTVPVTDAQAGLKPQSSIDYEIVREAVKAVAHWVATTRRAISDAGQLASLIDGRLRYGLAKVLDQQIVNGDGAGENLTGILNQPGILSQAKGSDSMLDATHKALTKIRLAFLEPTAAAFNPLDWEAIRLEKDTTGNYLYGPPALAGAQTIWGKPTLAGAQFPEGNPLVGDFAQAELWLREGVQVLASDSHADFFVRNLLALLAEMRVAFGVAIPEAFCEVTSA